MRMTLNKAVDPFLAFTFESQFYDRADSVIENGPDIRIKQYLNPILLTESAGLGRVLVKNEQGELLTRLGLAVRQRMVKDVVRYLPEMTETSTTTDGGVEWVTDYAQTFAGENLKYVSKLRVFKALFNSEAKDLEDSDVAAVRATADYWKTPDVAWENTLSASVSKYIQVSLFAELLYDKEIDVRGRFREVLGLGVTYKLF